MRHFSDTFALDEGRQRLCAKLIAEAGEFAHLHSARISCIASQRALVDRGQAVPGVVMVPFSEARSSAKRTLMDWLVAQFLKPLLGGEEADFLFAFDVALWPDDATEQEHLVYHLLCHIEQQHDDYGAPKFHRDGRPMLRLRNHDIERFESEIARYGSRIKGISDERGIYAQARAREQQQLRIAG